jgi:hypothetical protein
MQKPTRWQILVESGALATTISVALATFAQTEAGSTFRESRQHFFNFFVDAIPFWTLVFSLIFVLTCVIYFLVYYGLSLRSGSILSKDGVLLFDREQHIAISVATLKSILSTLANETAKGRANELLYRAGELAGKRFGGAFKEIYISQIEPHSNKSWATLGDNGKLDAWERYDATVGWGEINAHKYESRSIVDVVYRHPTLYEGAGGELFSWLLAGYSKEVAAALLGQNMRFEPQGGFVRDEGILRLQYTY